MRTLGIDLASAAERTGACLVQWGPEQAEVELLEVGLDDGAILDLAARADHVGIDAPFGWPQPFIEAMQAEGSGAPWPVTSWNPDATRALRFRKTDFFVHDLVGRWPLSVSSDLIGVPAMRCAGLLRALNVTDRSGADRAVEVYPSATLSQWGLRSSGYKGKDRRDRLQRLAGSLERATPWLNWGADWAREARFIDDAFDALVASLTVRAKALCLTLQPSEQEAEAASREGWIAVPRAGSLAQLI